ncbi:discoidin domain-containing protein [Solwaraspora sp. WMMB335]|uniref:discoidin domain-containing protein n=1 Tax=Solwaraspora sp. WMMB335 TaxID=3404118 RepID=UPI003B95140F
MARSIPAVPGVVTVVGQLAGPADWRAVAEALPIAVPPRTSALLAVAGAGSGAVGVAGPAPAAGLAEQLGSEVLAPTGRLLLVPGAALFAVDGFRLFGPAAAPVTAGRRHPTPAWEADIDALPAGGNHGLVQMAIPAGVWVYPQGPDPAVPGPDDLAYAIPVDVDRPVLLVGRPGHPTPDVDEVVAVLDALPVRLRTRLIVVPYGSGAAVCRELVRTLCGRWHGTVTMATGLPTLAVDDRLVSIAVDADPSHCWPQPVRQLVFPPSGPPRPVGPVEALANLALASPVPAEATTYRLNERWVVEAVQCGLWVRPPFVGRHGPAVRGRPWTPGQLEIVVGVPGLSPGDDVRSVLHELLARLPAAARQRVVISPAEVAKDLGLGPEPSHDAPDIVLVDDETGTPDWWRADPRLFTVLVGSADGDRIVTQAGEVGPGELGEIVATHGGWAGRPILLVSAESVPREFCQRLADQVQAVVISTASDDGWSAVLPRRTGRDESGPVHVPGPYPFPDDELKALVDGSVPVPAQLGRPAGDGTRATLDLRAKRGTDDDAEHRNETPPAAASMPGPLLVVGRGPDATRPFRLFGIPAGVWFVATAVATQRPEWTHGGCLIRLDVEQIDQVNLQLLANYLGIEVTVPADRLNDHPMGGEAADRWHTRPRRPTPLAGDPGQAGADLRHTGRPDVVAGIRRAIALRGLPGRLVPMDPPAAMEPPVRPVPVDMEPAVRPVPVDQADTLDGPAYGPVQAPAEVPDGPAAPDADDVPEVPDLSAEAADSAAAEEPTEAAEPDDAESATATVEPDDDADGRPDDELPVAGQVMPAVLWRLPDPPTPDLGPAPAAESLAAAIEVQTTWGPTLRLPVADRPPMLMPALPPDPTVPSLSDPTVSSLSDATVPIRVPTPARTPDVPPSRRNLRAGLVAAAFVAIVAVASGAAAQILNPGDAVAEQPQSDPPATTARVPTLATPGTDAVVSATQPGTGSAPGAALSTAGVGRTESAPTPTAAGPPAAVRTTAPALAPVRTTVPAPAPVRTTAQAPKPASGRTNSGGRNLALGAAVTASSAEGSHWAAKFAVDGDGSTRWGSAWQDPQWIRVDLGDDWVVTEVRLAWQSAYATGYRVEVSRDGVNWTTVFSTSNGTGGSLVVKVPSVVARHVRMYGTSRSSIYGYSLYEFEVR